MYTRAVQRTKGFYGMCVRCSEQRSGQSTFHSIYYVSTSPPPPPHGTDMVFSDVQIYIHTWQCIHVMCPHFYFPSKIVCASGQVCGQRQVSSHLSPSAYGAHTRIYYVVHNLKNRLCHLGISSSTGKSGCFELEANLFCGLSRQLVDGWLYMT